MSHSRVIAKDFCLQLWICFIKNLSLFWLKFTIFSNPLWTKGKHFCKAYFTVIVSTHECTYIKCEKGEMGGKNGTAIFRLSCAFLNIWPQVIKYTPMREHVSVLSVFGGVICPHLVSWVWLESFLLCRAAICSCVLYEQWLCFWAGGLWMTRLLWLLLLSPEFVSLLLSPCTWAGMVGVGEGGLCCLFV